MHTDHRGKPYICPWKERGSRLVTSPLLLGGKNWCRNLLCRGTILFTNKWVGNWAEGHLDHGGKSNKGPFYPGWQQGSNFAFCTFFCGDTKHVCIISCLMHYTKGIVFIVKLKSAVFLLINLIKFLFKKKILPRVLNSYLFILYYH